MVLQSKTYDVETTTAGLSSLWTATPTSSSIANVLPTYNTSTTIVVQLAESATPSDNGMFTIVVNESDGSASSSIDVYVSVAVVYNPHLDATGVGDQGLLSIQPGQSVDLSIPVSNHDRLWTHIFSALARSLTLRAGGQTTRPVAQQTQPTLHPLGLHR